MTDDDQAAAGADEAGTGDDEFSDPPFRKSLVPPDAVRPLANGVVFVVVWTAMLLYVGRGPAVALGLGLLGGAIYFVAAYYLL